MERNPIVSQTSDEVAIRLVKEPLSLRDLLPKYQYQFQDVETPIEAINMYSNLVEFLNTNEELAFNDTPQPQDEYVKGFQCALAMIRLWIDSIYIDKSE